MRITNTLSAIGLFIITAGLAPAAQQPRALAPEDDGRWEQLDNLDYYLKGATPAQRITDGERYIDRERDLQQRKPPAKPATTTTAGPR